MSTQFSPEDRRILIRGRLKRLRKQFFELLGRCRLQVSRDENLMIHCPEPWVVDSLMANLEEITEAARIIVGVQVLSLCFVGEEVYQTTTEPHYPIAS